ncbi:phage baseplate upper protein [Caldifermentibacillus hisashii]|uniref:phage baseplate upper protein n=1 Tax=Caldifermentibacillus hisashii TaxID=996558 RepID=UPI0034474C59
MADAPKINPKETLRESYKKLNQAIDNANEAIKKATTSDVNAAKALTTANSVQEQFNQVVIEGDSSVEAAQARVDADGNTYATLKERLDTKEQSFVTQLAEKANTTDILLKGRNLVQNSDFESLPYIISRSSIYTFTAGITSPQYNGKKSLKIAVTNYEGSTDANKDFAILLTETVTSAETLIISFWAYPSVSNKTIQIRMAYTGSGASINLGQANQWNKISFTLSLSDMTKQNNYLYFNFNSSFDLYMSDLQISNRTVTVNDVPNSLNQVNDVLVESASQIHNSRGSIERLIDNAQTYLDNIGKLTYGNDYTAYDPTQDLVDGKNQIDCSSFANLMIQGVPYNRSKYVSGNTQNVGSNLFFQNIDTVKWRYANNIAKYAFEKGYSFKPNADYSNLEPGDVLFFSWTNGVSGDLAPEARENAFMKIDHVAIFLHKKNEGIFSTLQFDNGISTVYYDVSPTYMSQCVLAARFPYANVESMYSDDNLILEGDNPKSITTGSTIGTYKLSQPLEKGKYYTLFLDGNVLTEGGYFVIQTESYDTIYSDFGKIGQYDGVTILRFPYLLDETTTVIRIGIGVSEGTPVDRSGNVNWCSLYKGYARSKKQYIRNFSCSEIKDFPLDPTLVSDLNSGYAPHYKYAISGNKILINFNLPFNTLRTGNLILGSIPANTVANTQRIPCNLIGSTNQAINAILQISFSGTVTIIPYDQTVQWKMAMANGCVFKN